MLPSDWTAASADPQLSEVFSVAGACLARCRKGQRLLPQHVGNASQDAASFRRVNTWISALANLHPEFFLRLYFTETEMMGPGKAALLDGIRQTGSISAAGRRLGMSYKRAWMLVETMNAMSVEPLVLSVRGGPGGGGARLSSTGERVLTLFREIEAHSLAANSERIEEMKALLGNMSGKK